MENATSPTIPTGWRFVSRIVFRFVFVYMLLYSLPVILGFPANLASSIAEVVTPGIPTTDSWSSHIVKYLSYPGIGFKWGVDALTPWICRTFLSVEVAPPPAFTGSGDGLFEYCSCFTCLILAAAVTFIWTTASTAWICWKTHRAPEYDRLHSLFRLIVSFHLMYMLLIYGAVKVWCAQFPPISDAQLDVTYGDSSPMGLLWRFMQFSQPYTTTTGIIEFTCGVLLITRRTTLLGCSVQPELLSKCFCLICATTCLSS